MLPVKKKGLRLIVDANIVFSGILNTNGKIGDLLINSAGKFNFIAPDFLKREIQKHYSRIAKISGMSIQQVKDSEAQICKEVTFISEEQIKASSWKAAALLCEDIDPGDTPYVAFSKHFRCKIWSGDKTLIRGLARKNFHNFVTTEELFVMNQKSKNV